MENPFFWPKAIPDFPPDKEAERLTYVVYKNPCRENGVTMKAIQ